MINCWGCSNQPDYLKPNLPVDQRVEDLVSRMTLREKISQMSHLAPAIERLGVHAYEPNFNNPLSEEMYKEVSAEEGFVKKTGPGKTMSIGKKVNALMGAGGMRHYTAWPVLD